MARFAYARRVDFSAPFSALLSESIGALLATLAGTTRPLSGRELARLSECPHSTARSALQRFAEHGLVNVQEAGAGAVLLYSLNRQHVAADAVLLLTNLRRSFAERLGSQFDAWQVRPLHASIFGSAARADGDTTSDVDVFLVRPVSTAVEDSAWRSQVEGLPDLILSWTGNHAGIVEVSREEVQSLVQKGAPIVGELVRDAITLSGTSVKDLINNVSQ